MRCECVIVTVTVHQGPCILPSMATGTSLQTQKASVNENPWAFLTPKYLLLAVNPVPGITKLNLVRLGCTLLVLSVKAITQMQLGSWTLF